MLNREFYEKDPRTNILLNNGVAKVTTGQSDPEIERSATRSAIRV